MVLTIYIIILSYFVLGAFGFWYINRKKDRQTAQKSRIKFISYFFIIHILFFSIVFNSFIFSILSFLIVLAGLVEIIKLYRESGFRRKKFRVASMLLYILLCIGFLYFSRLDKNLILFTFLVISIFDAFSQISGQLFGKRKLFPEISPGKTVEGLVGGGVIAIASSILIKQLAATGSSETLLLAAGIVVFAFLGDMAASAYKRIFGVKDFSQLIPGHGGFLDRFDSLIAGGFFIALLNFFDGI